MSLAHRRVRERGTWRSWALAAAVVLVVVTSSPTVAAKPRASSTIRFTFGTHARPIKAQRPKPHMKRPTSITGMIRDEFDEHADEALRVARCESRFDPDATYAGAVGIFQIRTSLHAWRTKKVGGGELTDPRTNVRVARHLFDDEGWGPWTCARITGVSA